MSEGVKTVKSLLADIRIAISLCTRLPVAPPGAIADGEVARASWALPLAGMLVGVVSAAVYWLAQRLHIASQPAAVLALAASILLTGAMHEDGLADTADGLGGGKTRERKLEIMRDSRIGTFGALALAVSLLMRWSAIASIDDPRSVAIALVVAHGAARATLPAFMAFVPPARPDGLSSGAGQPPPQSIAIALGLGIIALGLGFGATAMLVGILVLAAISALLARLSREQIGGQTGDVLGALEQTAEAALLLIAAALAAMC
jgi:adenosylcobinamide-GDP ribazoletransferase